LPSYKDNGDLTHSVDRDEWVIFASEYLDKLQELAEEVKSDELRRNCAKVRKAFGDSLLGKAPWGRLRGPVAHVASPEAPVEVRLRVKRCSVLIRQGTDHISMVLDAPTPYPNMGYDAVLNIEAQKGYGIEWVRKNCHLEPEIINGPVS
jgi:hypothetical protein